MTAALANPIQQFRDAIAQADLNSPSQIITDGRLHRFSSSGRPGDDAGWYIYHNGNVPVGSFGCWREGITETWCANIGRRLTQAEQSAHRAQMAHAAQQRAVETEVLRAKAKANANAIIARATKAGADHPYVMRKNISAEPFLEITQETLLEVIGYCPRVKKQSLQGPILLAPIRVAGEISNVEFIDIFGLKCSLFGGVKSGGYWEPFSTPEGNGRGSTLLISEGCATLLTAIEATGFLGRAALSCHNLEAIASEAQRRFPRAKIVILADVGKGEEKAVSAADHLGVHIAIPNFGDDRPDNATDFNDLAHIVGHAEVKKQIVQASKSPLQPSLTTMEAEVARLSALSSLDYQRQRQEAANWLGLRISILDAEVGKAQSAQLDKFAAPFDEVEPWPEGVIGSELLNEIRQTIARFIICEPETAIAASLWIVMTWLMDVIHVAPLAVITAPEKRCGKSQLLTLFGRLVAHPLPTAGITSAALFRCIDSWKPTLLIDETDALLKDNEELRGLLNAGHTRDNAYAIRCVGEDHNPKRFFVWGAKALAGIGKLADTLMDRSITLELRRRLPHERIDRLRHADSATFSIMKQKIARWTLDHASIVGAVKPDAPTALNDRAQDNWESLFAIADAAGGEWPALARTAALTISGDASLPPSMGQELLADIKAVFDAQNVDRIATAGLIAALCEDEEAPWVFYDRGKRMTPRQLSTRLHPYGINSTTIRLGHSTAKGYLRQQFQDAFVRYLSVAPTQAVTPSQGAENVIFPVTDRLPVSEIEIDKVTAKSNCSAPCDGVTGNLPTSDGEDDDGQWRATI